MNIFYRTSSKALFLLTANDIFGPTVAMTLPGIVQPRLPGELRLNV